MQSHFILKKINFEKIRILDHKTIPNSPTNVKFRVKLIFDVPGFDSLILFRAIGQHHSEIDIIVNYLIHILIVWRVVDEGRGPIAICCQGVFLSPHHSGPLRPLEGVLPTHGRLTENRKRNIFSVIIFYLYD